MVSLRSVVGLLVGALVLWSPTAVLAASTGSAVLPAGNSGSSPFSPALPSGPTTPTTTAIPTVSTASTTGDSSLSGGAAIGIAVGAAVVLGGIALFIWRDARRRAPVRAGAGGLGTVDSPARGSKAKPKPRKLSPAERKRRKRGKAR